jgi:peptidyl-prolyl cis-trans isomerase D
MLAAIRAFAKSWVAAVLIGLLIVSFAIFGIHDVFRAGPRNSVLVVGDRTISPADFKREFETFRRGAEQQMGGPLTPDVISQNHLDARVLEGLATSEAFYELLRRIGVHPSDQQAVGELRKIPAFFDQVSGRFDEKLYQQRLAENDLTPARFEQGVRDQIAEEQLARGLYAGLRVPRAYTALAAIYNLESRDVGYFSVGPGSVPEPALPTDVQLTQFMKDHAAELKRPEYRIVTVARFAPSAIAANLPVDEAAVKKRYEFRKDTLSTPETRSLVQIPAKDAATGQQIVQRLTKGEDPGAVAKSLGVDAINYADKPQSAIPDRKLAAAAFALPAGQVSAIHGDLGQAVVKVIKATPGHAVTLEEARPQIEAELRKDAAAEKVYDLTQAYDDAHSKGAGLAEAAQKAGVPTVTLPPLSKEGATQQGQQIQGLPPKLLEQAYSLPAGGESEVEEAGPGEYFALKVEKIIPSAAPTLEEVKPQLVRYWMVREMAKRLNDKANGLAARVRKGETLEAVASSIGGQVTRVTNLDRTNASDNKQLSRDALGKTFGAKAGDVFVADDTHFGVIVAKVEGLRPGDNANLARLTEEARPQMSMAVFRELGESARRAARDQVKIKVNPDAARSAIGLEPLATDKTQGKAELAK